MEQYLAVRDAARRLGCSRATIWNLIRQYEIPTYRRAGDRRTHLRVRDLERLETFEQHWPQSVRLSQPTEAAWLPGVDWGALGRPGRAGRAPTPDRPTSARRRGRKETR